MRKELVALACLVGAGGSCAQSSVTVFGSLDLNLTYSKVGGSSATALDQGGYMLPSRIGFRGTEDLGGGLYAAFWLESALLPDTGAIQGAFFGRRSTVSLGSREYGELRLGRDYTPTFWNISAFTPFGTVGVAGSSNLVEGWPLGLGVARTQSRASNSIGYFLPSKLGGVYGQVMVAASEGQDGNSYTGGRLGYESGPLNVAAAFGRTSVGTTDYKVSTVGGAYDLDVAKLFVNYLRQELGQDRQANVVGGVSVPVGPGFAKFSYGSSKRSGAATAGNDATQIGVGYVYLLSKRTTLYSAYSRIRNKEGAAYVVAGSSPPGQPGVASSGLQLGMRHDF